MTVVNGSWHRGRKAGGAGGFSLVELLVVIAIVAILIAMTGAALKSARRQARLVACASNLHHLANSTHAYAAEFDGAIPAGPGIPFPLDPAHSWTEFATGWVWIGALQQYSAHGLLLNHGLRDLTPIFCPADRTIKPSEQLVRLGTAKDAYGTYTYRQLDQTSGGKIENLGFNNAGGKARALFVDTLFDGPTPELDRSTHDEVAINVAYVEGYVLRLRNNDQQFNFDRDAFMAMPESFEQRINDHFIALDAAANGGPGSSEISSE